MSKPVPVWRVWVIDGYGYRYRTHIVVWKMQGSVHEGLRLASELHLVRVQHTAHPLDEPVLNL